MDDLILEASILGIDGWVGGTGIAFPKENQYLWDLTRAGRWEEARALYRWFQPADEARHPPPLRAVHQAVRARSRAGNRMGPRPRLPIAGDERKQVLKIIRDGIKSRPKMRK